ncbi:MAG: ATP-binding protein [Acidobacteriota bacterium]
MGRRVLQILNEAGDLAESMHEIAVALKAGTEADAVAIRLRDGEDFPFWAQEGFPEDVLRTSGSPVLRDADGGGCQDSDGRMCLEGVCGLVVSGKPDPSSPFITQGGSFCTGDYSLFAEGGAAEGPRVRPCTRCIRDGYASVALVPIWSESQVVGLLQFNDRRTHRFSVESVELLEVVAAQIGVAAARDRSEQKLRASEQKHRTILETATDGFWLVDRQGRLREVNKAYCRMSGYSEPELLAMRVVDLDMRVTGGPFADHLAELGARGDDRFETTHRRKDGSTFDVEISVQYQPFDGGRAVCFLRDVTERKLAEQALATSMDTLRARADWAHGLQVAGKQLGAATTLDEVVQLAASALRDYLGATMVWVCVPGGGPRVQLLASAPPHHVGDVPLSDACLVPGRKSGVDVCAVNFPHEACPTPGADCAKRGSCGTWLCSSSDGLPLCAVTASFSERGPSSPIVGADSLISVFCQQVGSAWQHILVEQNLRELADSLADATKAANAANAAKSAFLASMSHELRTPLGAIIGFSELLEERLFGELTPKQGQHVGRILESGRHLLDLINDILDLSKIEAGKECMVWEAFPLAALLDESVLVVNDTCVKKRIVLTADIDPALRGLNVTADERKLKQVMSNLLSNAVKFSPPGAAVTVRARRDGDNVMVSVADTGVGVSRKHQHELFKEFYQVNRSDHDKIPGTGLGLAIVKRLIASHGGRVWMESEGEGKGSTFQFAIPIHGSRSTDAPMNAQESEAARWAR